MRVAYLVHQYFPRHVGGTEIYVRGLARRARARGHDVLIITYHESPSPDVSGFGICHTRVDDIPVAEIHYNLSVAPRPARNEYDNPWVADRAEEELDRFTPDVVHAAHAMKLSGAVLELCQQRGWPVLVTLCDFWFLCPRHTLLKWNDDLCQGPKDPRYCRRCLTETHGFASFDIAREGWSPRALTRSIIRLAHDWQDIGHRQDYLLRVLNDCQQIVALSDFMKSLMTAYGVPADRIEVLPHGPELEGVTVNRAEPARPVSVAFIGSLSTHKGVHLLIEALKRRPDLDVRLKLYGAIRKGDAYVDRLLADSRNDPRIHWIGTFPVESLGRVLSGTDLLALPALWYENAPLVVKSALHFGIPCLVSDLGTLSEMVREGQDGWRIPPGDVEALIRVLERVAEQPALCKIQARPAPSIDEHAERVFSLYQAMHPRP